jgi:hypothetical protein
MHFIFIPFNFSQLAILDVEYSNTFNPPANATMKHLTNLLEKLENLEKLSLIGVSSFSEHPFSENPNFLFRLQRMTVDSLDGDNLSVNDVKNFLISQRNSLRFLKVFKKPSEEIFEFVKNEMKLNKFDT